MSTDEGSVMVDGETGSVNENEVEETQQETQQETKTEEVKVNTEQKADKEVQYTEKGTKLDPNPLSALNQQLANSERQRKEYEAVLTSPETLVKYAKTMGLDLTKTEANEIVREQEIDPDNIETVEDLRAFAKKLESKIEAKAADLDKGLNSLNESKRDEQIASVIKTDITAVRELYPELDPKMDADGKPTNPDYDQELDEAVASLYEMADFDSRTGKYLGKARLIEVAKKVMNARQKGIVSGSRDAQTVIKDKTRAKTITGASDFTQDESGMTAAQVIASRMKRMAGG